MPTDRPNILVLMPDQMRADCLSVAGHPAVRTPTCDRLAAEGTRFGRCYTSSPVCMPARSTFASGLFCHNHGQWYNYGELREDDPTYMKRLRAAGYRTAHIGKSHLFLHSVGVGEHTGMHLDHRRPFLHALGFDDVIETTGNWSSLVCESALSDHWREKGLMERFVEDYRERQKGGREGGTWPSPLPEGETMDDFVGRNATEYVENYDRDMPLCLFVGFPGPHHPWDPPASWAARYEGVETPPPLAPPAERADLPPAARAYAEAIGGPAVSPEALGAIRRLYYAKIAHIDDWCGRIIEAFERTGRWENTFVLFWSDHGERLGDRGGFHKMVFYDESARVPLLVRRPDGVGAGAVAEGLCGTADMAATLCAAAGVESVGFGRSLLPLTESPDATVHDAVFSEINHRHIPVEYTTMIRTDRYKMVIDAQGRTLQLFDRKTDPQEMENLAGRAAEAGTEAALRERILRWRLATENDDHRRETG